MANRNILIIITLVITITHVSSIMFKLVSNEPTCIKFSGNNTYVIDYVVSG